jgi:hypothetical protein
VLFFLGLSLLRLYCVQHSSAHKDAHSVHNAGFKISCSLSFNVVLQSHAYATVAFVYNFPPSDKTVNPLDYEVDTCQKHWDWLEANAAAQKTPYYFLKWTSNYHRHVPVESLFFPLHIGMSSAFIVIECTGTAFRHLLFRGIIKVLTQSNHLTSRGLHTIFWHIKYNTIQIQ